jgi:hypothetical protein
MARYSKITGCADRPVLDGVGDRLRQMFDSLASDRMPDHLLALVDQLEAGYIAPPENDETFAAEPIPG